MLDYLKRRASRGFLFVTANYVRGSLRGLVQRGHNIKGLQVAENWIAGRKEEWSSSRSLEAGVGIAINYCISVRHCIIGANKRDESLLATTGVTTELYKF